MMIISIVKTSTNNLSSYLVLMKTWQGSTNVHLKYLLHKLDEMIEQNNKICENKFKPDR